MSAYVRMSENHEETKFEIMSEIVRAKYLHMKGGREEEEWHLKVTDQIIDGREEEESEA